MSHSEVKRLPIRYRKWYLERLAKHFKSINEKRGKESINDPQPLSVDNFSKFDDLVSKKLSQK
jgi:hypothetical protein